MSNTNSGLLGIKDIVFMNVIAILSLRQIPNVAPYGASAMLLWVIAAFCLFFPLAMVCGELSTGWPKDGGILSGLKRHLVNVLHGLSWFVFSFPAYCFSH
ncbi:putative amino acid transporter [Salmonella enterica subsp. enterica]|nr:putative amino acid transporter [Salmonella enterica subsp. enterica]